MELELLKLIYDYSIKNKLVDNAFIADIIAIAIRYKHLYTHIKSFTIEPHYQSETQLPNNTIAAYNSFLKEIIIYTEGIEHYIQESTKYQTNFNKVEQLFYINILITKALLHEIEHANQHKILETEQTMEAKILTLSCGYFNETILQTLINQGLSEEFIKHYTDIKYQQYNDNYLIAPNERLAEIKAYQEILNILHFIRKNTPHLIELIQRKQLENMFRGYKKTPTIIKAPTITYFQKLNIRFGTIPSLSWYIEDQNQALNIATSQHQLNERLLYGLPITVDEFNTVKHTLIKAKKNNT